MCCALQRGAHSGGSGRMQASSRSAGKVVSRLLDLDDLGREFAAIAAFHRRGGVPGMGPDWFHSVGRAAWPRQNPSVYRLYEADGEIVGFLGRAPLREECAADLLAGR